MLKKTLFGVISMMALASVSAGAATMASANVATAGNANIGHSWATGSLQWQVVSLNPKSHSASGTMTLGSSVLSLQATSYDDEGNPLFAEDNRSSGEAGGNVSVSNTAQTSQSNGVWMSGSREGLVHLQSSSQMNSTQSLAPWGETSANGWINYVAMLAPMSQVTFSVTREVGAYLSDYVDGALAGAGGNFFAWLGAGNSSAQVWDFSKETHEDQLNNPGGVLSDTISFSFTNGTMGWQSLNFGASADSWATYELGGQGFGITGLAANVSAVPEPTSLALMVGGLPLLMLSSRLRKARKG